MSWLGSKGPIYDKIEDAKKAAEKVAREEEKLSVALQTEAGIVMLVDVRCMLDSQIEKSGCQQVRAVDGVHATRRGGGRDCKYNFFQDESILFLHVKTAILERGRKKSGFRPPPRPRIKLPSA